MAQVEEPSEGYGSEDEATPLVVAPVQTAVSEFVKNEEIDRGYQDDVPQVRHGGTSADEQEETPDSDLSDNFGSIMNIIKGNVGTGILAIPKGFISAGLVGGAIGIAFFGIVCTHCMHLLVNCSHKLSPLEGKDALTYSESMEAAVKRGPQPLQKFHRAAKMIVNIFLLITQFGFCCVYILFVAQNVQQVIEHYTPAQLPVQAYEAVVVVCLIPFLFIKSLRVLGYFSFGANILSILCLGAILVYLFQDLPPVESRPSFAPIMDFPLFFGTTIYAFEGISLVLPVENKMRYKHDFPGLTGVLNTGMVIVIVLYFSVGFYGYLRFGSITRDSITLNLPTGNIIFVLVKLLFAVSIFISYLIQFYVPMDILLPRLKQRFTARIEPFFRIMCVLGTFAIAAAVNKYLGSLISLIGALASSTLALIFPPILEMFTLWQGRRDNRWWYLIVVKDLLIMFVGIIGFITGTYAAILNLIQNLQSGS